MTRLDSFIRRLVAQRACLDAAIALIGERPGTVLELGLGNGRSFDHLRTKMPGRRIVVVEREPHPHPCCQPQRTDLVIGTFEEILPHAEQLLPADLVLVHADIGTGDDVHNAEIAGDVAANLDRFLPGRCIVASDQAFMGDRLIEIAVPEGIEPGRYHLYRVTSHPLAHIMVTTPPGTG